MANEIPVSVDYTSRDYYAIREELIERVKTRIPEWSGNDSSDFGVALIEAFAYMGDIANYYIDRIANEAFIAYGAGTFTSLLAGYCAQFAKSGMSETYASCSPLKVIVVCESGTAGMTRRVAFVSLK